MTEDKPRILKAFTLMHGDDGKWAVTLNDYDDDGIYGDSISTAMIFLAIRKTLLGVLIVLAFVYAVMATVQIARAQSLYPFGPFVRACRVFDPTGTPLNVRSEPNGAIRGVLHNNTEVLVTNWALAANPGQRHRPISKSRWSKIVPLKGGKTGWVFADYLDCDYLDTPVAEQK